MVPGEWRTNTNIHLAIRVQQSGNRNAANACWVMDKLKEYVNGVRKVLWQEGIVFGKRRQIGKEYYHIPLLSVDR